MNNPITGEYKVKVKQTIDSFLTDLFLNDTNGLIRNEIKDIATSVNQDLKNEESIKYHYLKGGNAIKILEEKESSGDWDFQVVPEQDKLDDADEKILEILKDKKVEFAAINRVGEVSFVLKLSKELDLKAFNVELKKKDQNIKPKAAGTGGSDGYEYKMNMEQLIGTFMPIYIGEVIKSKRSISSPAPKVTYVDDNFMDFEAGKANYFEKSEPEIYVSNKMDKKDNRIKLEEDEIVSTNKNDIPNENYFTPIVYVNYTIPGFILYRLCIDYTYVLESGDTQETIHFKSEAVDISIPRKGSAESLLSTESDIFEKGGFTIPGWRYHMFENIMLISENNLGISGSPHKLPKRKKRGNLAIDKLLGINKTKDKKALCWMENLKDESGKENPSYLFQLMNDLKYNNEALSGKYAHFKDFLDERLKTYDKKNVDSETLATIDNLFLNGITVNKIINGFKEKVATTFNGSNAKLKRLYVFKLYLDPISSAARLKGLANDDFKIALLECHVDTPTYEIFSLKKDKLSFTLNNKSTILDIYRVGDDTSTYNEEPVVEEIMENLELHIYLKKEEQCKEDIKQLLGKVQTLSLRYPLINLYKKFV